MEGDPASISAPGPEPTHARPRVDRQELAAIFAGGVIGTLARAGLVEALVVRRGAWPWATFLVNIAAAFALGYFITRLQGRPHAQRYRRSFIGAGLCGALSTFSTMMVELLRMVDRLEWGLALGYATASIACGFAAVALARRLARRAGLA